MATRAGVSEYSTSPIAQRRSERSIRASWTTGFWGAEASIRASISTRFATTAATTRRASLPAAGLASTSARSRSRTAVAVRWPKSASNTADSATRRPARSERTRSARRSSAPDTIDQDGDGPDLQAQQPLDSEPYRLAHVPAGRNQIGAGPGDDPKLELDALRPNVHGDRRTRKRGAPARPAARDLEHVRDVQCGLADDVDDDAAADRQLDGCLGRRT